MAPLISGEFMKAVRLLFVGLLLPVQCFAVDAKVFMVAAKHQKCSVFAGLGEMENAAERHARRAYDLGKPDYGRLNFYRGEANGEVTGGHAYFALCKCGPGESRKTMALDLYDVYKCADLN